MPETPETATEKSGRYSFLVEIATGLRSKPAYLLIFGVCALFLVSGIGNSIAGAAKGDRWLLGFGLISFIAALMASLLTVRLIERDHYVAPSFGDAHVLHSHRPSGEGLDSHLEANTIIDSFSSDLDARFSDARNVVLFGVHQSHILIRYYDLIKKKLVKGDSFRVLVMNPSGHAVRMTTLRFPGPRRDNQEIERIQSSIESFLELKRVAPQRLEIRSLDFLYAYGGFLFDPEMQNGVCYIQRYTFRVHGGSRKPKFVLNRQHHQDWFNLYHQEIEALWSAAHPIELSDAGIDA